MLSEPDVAFRDELDRRSRESQRERSNVRGGTPCREPAPTTSVSADPLLGQRGLPVAGGSDERLYPGRRLVEQGEEARPLDDPAALERPWGPDCRRRGPPLTSLWVPTLPPRTRRGRPRKRRSSRAPGSAGRLRHEGPAVPCGQRILSGQKAERDRDLASAPYTELLPQHVAVRLGRSGGDSESRSDLVVRASRRDQRDDLALALRDPLRPSLRDQLDH